MKVTKRVVVIGASGFIGKQLCRDLEALGAFEVVAIGRKTVDLTKLGSGDMLKTVLKPGDVVVMLSTITPDKGKTRLDFFNNVRMGLEVCEALSRVPPAHIVYLSSDAVYSFEDAVIQERTQAAPQDLYGAMHRARELLFESLGVPLLVIRPTLVYGLEDTHNAYGPNRFIRQAYQDRCIKLFGQGEEKRSHIAVQDLAHLIIQGIKAQETGILNAATEPSASFLEIAKKIQQAMPFPITIEYDVRKTPITHRHFDLSHLYQRFPGLACREWSQGMSEMLKIKATQRVTT